MSRVALLPRPAHAAAAETPSLAVSDLTMSGDEPRIIDVALAGRLSFVQPRDIRKIIERNRLELGSYGRLVSERTRAGRALRHGGAKAGGRTATTYLLNEGQALLICALARTTMAARIRRELITVFMDYRRGTLAPPAAPEPVLVRRDLTAVIATVSTLADQLQALCSGHGAPPQPDARPEVALPPPTPVLPVAGLLYGLPAIGRHLGLGSRQVAHLKDAHGLPVMKLGKRVAARPAALESWLASRALAGEVRS